jgi:hypothetical protein
MGHIYRLRQKIEPVLANPLLLDARTHRRPVSLDDMTFKTAIGTVL